MSIAKPIPGHISRILRASNVRLAGRSLAVALAALHTWAAISAYSMNADGIVYMDIGDAFWRGDWGTAVNAVWSPLYAWILGLALRLFNPAMTWEFTLVHLVDFAIYVSALLCFEQLWRQLWLYQQTEQQNSHRLSLPEWAWLTIGYTLFIWVSLSLIEIWAVTPDMLMACFVYLAAAQLVRLRRGADQWRHFALLGVWLGLGYLSKAIMFPLAFVFLFIALFSLENVRRAWPKVLLSLLVFLLISGPWIALISASRGRFTFSDASTITYLRYVQGLPFVHWQGEDPPVNGTPLHPTRQVLATPPVYEFATPIGGTYPVATDPVFWYEGAQTRLNVAAQIRLLLASGLFYLDLFARQQAVLVTAVLLGWWLAGARPSAPLSLLRRYGLTLIALAAFALYAPVLV
ncbi:MAG TPA: glycosyltransferase family 39 protein, partial [Chloroflexota bacterium]|nr:glycosyltransferase family 39 protein [Chloroflexota bacterium]